MRLSKWHTMSAKVTQQIGLNLCGGKSKSKVL